MWPGMTGRTLWGLTMGNNGSSCQLACTLVSASSGTDIFLGSVSGLQNSFTFFIALISFQDNFIFSALNHFLR